MTKSDALLQRKSPADVGACLNVMNPVLRRWHDGAGTLALRLARSSTKVRDSIAHQVLACSTYLHSFMTTFFAGICFNEHAPIQIFLSKAETGRIYCRQIYAFTYVIEVLKHHENPDVWMAATLVMSAGAKRITVNIGCKDITLIISRYVEHASTWRGIFEP